MTSIEERGGLGMPESPIAPEKPRSRFNIELSPKRIKRDELVHLSRQLAAFLRAGDLATGLKILLDVVGKIVENLVEASGQLCTTKNAAVVQRKVLGVLVESLSQR